MAALRNASQDKVVATHFLIITDLFFGISGPDDITKLLSYLRFEAHRVAIARDQLRQAMRASS